MFTSSYLQIDMLRTLMLNLNRQTMSLYDQQERSITDKRDGTPVTDADLQNDRTLNQALPQLLDVPVYSEENYPDYSQRQHCRRYWLVDPIDGTKEFIHRVPEFCVLVALIESGRPVMSAISVPAQGVCYIAEKGKGVWKANENEGGRLSAKAFYSAGLISRFHQEEQIERGYQMNGIKEVLRRGSATKFIALCEGEAKAYFRAFGPHEWDIAAGDLLVEEMGGRTVSLLTGESLIYNQKVSRIAPFVSLAPNAGLSDEEFQVYKSFLKGSR